ISKGLEIVYLEDVNMNIERLNHHIDYFDTKSFEDFMKMFNIFTIERDKFKKKQIKKENPDISFVGISHANQWYFERDFNAQYLFEIANLGYDKALLDESPIFSKKLWQLNRSFTKLCNLYFNNQFDSKSPDYLGTWDIGNLIGHFEINLRNGRGVMEDFLGSAVIEGTISTSKIDFNKQYEEGANTYISDNIHFIGKNKRGKYNSRFNSGEFAFFKKKKYDINQFREVFEFLNDLASKWKYDSNRLIELREKQLPLENNSLNKQYYNIGTEKEFDDIPF
ncbi:MAG: hypothetical protein OQK82_05995, partial [Candidatus Pacearchaeota archaeon]|nr:hypothetical protein [Candidatus Pacearchaeota archaeon]